MIPSILAAELHLVLGVSTPVLSSCSNFDCFQGPKQKRTWYNIPLADVGRSKPIWPYWSLSRHFPNFAVISLSLFSFQTVASDQCLCFTVPFTALCTRHLAAVLRYCACSLSACCGPDLHLGGDRLLPLPLFAWETLWILRPACCTCFM